MDAEGKKEWGKKNVGDFVAKKADAQTLETVKPHTIPRLKSPIILYFEEKNRRGVWGRRTA
jgi:hypothetical protein